MEHTAVPHFETPRQAVEWFFKELARRYGLTEREGQVKAASVFTLPLYGERNTVVGEGQTGLGKTYAYLTPFVLYLAGLLPSVPKFVVTEGSYAAGATDLDKALEDYFVKNGDAPTEAVSLATPRADIQRVMIVTASKLLQDQLLKKDLPFLAQAASKVLPSLTPETLSYGLLVGRTHYICRLRVHRAIESLRTLLEADAKHAKKDDAKASAPDEDAESLLRMLERIYDAEVMEHDEIKRLFPKREVEYLETLLEEFEVSISPPQDRNGSWRTLPDLCSQCEEPCRFRENTRHLQEARIIVANYHAFAHNVLAPLMRALRAYEEVQKKIERGEDLSQEDFQKLQGLSKLIGVFWDVREERPRIFLIFDEAHNFEKFVSSAFTRSIDLLETTRNLRHFVNRMERLDKQGFLVGSDATNIFTLGICAKEAASFVEKGLSTLLEELKKRDASPTFEEAALILGWHLGRLLRENERLREDVREALMQGLLALPRKKGLKDNPFLPEYLSVGDDDDDDKAVLSLSRTAIEELTERWVRTTLEKLIEMGKADDFTALLERNSSLYGTVYDEAVYDRIKAVEWLLTMSEGIANGFREACQTVLIEFQQGGAFTPGVLALARQAPRGRLRSLEELAKVFRRAYDVAYSNRNRRLEAEEDARIRIDFTFGTAIDGTDLVVHPVGMREILQRFALWRKLPKIFTSATIAVGRDRNFDYFVRSTGLDRRETVTFVAQSPFRFEQQMLIHVPEMPDPVESPEEWQSAVIERLRALPYSDRGGILVLFTSRKLLRDAYDALQEDFEKKGLRLLAQTVHPIRDIRRLFTGEEARKNRMVLFGLQSFWQGLDAPGELLNHLILVRLPFDEPNDPVLRSLYENERNRILNYLLRKTDLDAHRAVRIADRKAFKDLSLARALLLFRQGVGRLIRTETDTGIVTILDPRVLTSWYGKEFLGSLPEGVKVTRSDRTARQFLKKGVLASHAPSIGASS
ncbi:ATP-dependent DNA helicase [Thermosulfurimonas sp. F29]|uniref:ATP-dependent DNA helicase n=1 Tax=Thermosulfurimonas sp. F29 TaxID=2867247 RepID=UPI001C83DDE5|nr:helicase C-terminal domain-containing protein [Thermosulfurimonas sp. F29]MBX6424161.1 hypothetical protein [Thermosulfurimonas sp. F29]